MKRFLLFLFCIFICTTCIFAQTPAQDTTFKKIRFGGYGEMLYQRMNYGPDRYTDPKGSPKDKRANISIPRAIFAFDYKFRHDIVLSTEVEFEYGGTGAAVELEYSEAGEYETEIEKGGEVVLEQFHITKSFGKAFNVRVGHMIVPIGLTNAHHEPLFFFGSTRPEGETTIIPSTWHETGLALLGSFDKIGLSYEAMVVNGLDPNGFSKANWVGSGRQKIFEKSIMTSPAFALRLEYTPSFVQGLRVGASGYYGNTAKNSTKPQSMSGLKGTVAIYSGDVQYTNHNITARGNIIYGTLSDSEAISNINRRLFKATGYPCTPVAAAAMTYGGEIGYNIFSFFGSLKSQLIPFVRYEYHNTYEKTEGNMLNQPRYKIELFMAGINYRILPNLVVKTDYSVRSIDKANYNYEHTFSIGVAYMGWFVKK